MPSAIYAGSFDPPTVGHVNILLQASRIFSKICILVATNPAKAPMFTAEDRVRIWEGVIESHWANLDHKVDIQILPLGKYTAVWAAEKSFTHMIRGLRGASDLEDEITLHDINRRIDARVETVYFITTPNLRAVSSSAVKTLVGPKDWESVVENLVPNASLEALTRMYQ